MTFENLPHLNALLNTVSAVLLACGYVAIRRRNRKVHACFMLAAFVVSTLFLASYLTYHSKGFQTPYEGTGWQRPIYFTILISHIILAAVTLPLAIATLILALRKRLEKHRKVARWTFPIWMYVSVTGVVVYWMLYW